MAMATIELRKLLGTVNSKGEPFELFDFDYTFDDPIMRERLEQMVEQYYLYHEIGLETPERFKDRFVWHWQRNIRRANELWNLLLMEYDPLITTKYKETYQGDSAGWAHKNTRGTDKLTGTDTMARTGTGDVVRTDNLTQTDHETLLGEGHTTGTETTATTGTDVKQSAGTETVTTRGTDTRSTSGTDKTATTGTDEMARTGTNTSVTTDQNRTIADIGSEKSDNRETVSNYPQHAIPAPSGDLSTGYLDGGALGPYADGSRMSQNDLQRENTRTLSGSTSVEATPNLKDTRTANLTNTRTPNLTETRTPELTDTRTPNLTETRTPDLMETRTPNLTETKNDIIDKERHNTGTESTKTTNDFVEEATKNLTDAEDRTTQGSDERKQNWLRTFEGLTGRSYQSLIKEQMELVLDIEEIMLEGVKPCFFMVYSW